MKGSLDPALKLRLKQMILAEADRDAAPDSVSDDEALFGPHSALKLDSIDGLQISMALQLQFNVRITDPKELAKVMRSINTLADHLQPL